jgi:hypothetical protein
MVVTALMLAAFHSGRSDLVAQQFTDWIRITWQEGGDVWFSDRRPDKWTAVALGALLIDSGQISSGRQVLESALAQMQRDAVDLGRGYDLWYSGSAATALAWLGRNEEALDALQRGEAAGNVHHWWYTCGLEPAFEALRTDSRFLALCARAEANAKSQRELLDAMQQRGEVALR